MISEGYGTVSILSWLVGWGDFRGVCGTVSILSCLVGWGDFRGGMVL